MAVPDNPSLRQIAERRIRTDFPEPVGNGTIDLLCMIAVMIGGNDQNWLVGKSFFCANLFISYNLYDNN